MAVDFSLIPPEIPMSKKPPSRWLWTIVFFVLVLAGMAIVLLMWPKDMPTQTVEFWITLLGFPVAIAALVVLRRYSMYEGYVLDVEIQNEVNRDYTEQVFTTAKRPLAVIGTSHRFSVDADENAVKGIFTNSLALETQASFMPDTDPVKARWLVVPGIVLTGGSKSDDYARQQQALQWLFVELLTDISARIQSLPDRLPLNVHLLVASGMASDTAKMLWQSCWSKFSLRYANVEIASEIPDLMTLDHWLDHADQPTNQQARLIVAVQLHTLLSGNPPEGSAEAGVAILLLPDASAGQHKVTAIANLHRPVRGPSDQSNDVLEHALRWVEVGAADFGSVWQAGLTPEQAGAFRQSAVKQGLAVQASDLDTTIGHAGIAAPWLAIACAAGSEVSTQLILAGQSEHIDCAVLLRPVLATAASTSLTT